jgi:hypothetical protein
VLHWPIELRWRRAATLSAANAHSPKTPAVIVKILVAMHLSAVAPELHPARPPPRAGREAGYGEGWTT